MTTVNSYVVTTKSGSFKVKNLFMFQGFCNNWHLKPEIVDKENKLVKFSGEHDGYLTDRIVEEDENSLTYGWFDNELFEVMEVDQEVFYMQKEKGLITLTKNTSYEGSSSLETEVIMLNDKNIEDLKSWLL